MSPIKDVSQIRRMPRLGKVRLGIKVEKPGKNPYPRATDYFVVLDEIKDFIGEKPKQLKIMFPSEKVEEFAQQWLRCYSMTQGLICKGDGATAVRKIDVDTGDIARRTTLEWAFKDWLCDPDSCPEYIEGKQCRRVMNLLFLMPDVPGFGVWQLDTSSFYSIVNINSCIDLIKRICGRISFVPLSLSLEALQVTPPGERKKTIHVLTIRSDFKLADIQRIGMIPAEKVLLPTVEEEAAPGDLFPQAAAAEPEKKAPKAEVKEEGTKETTEEDVPDYNTLFRICFDRWDMQPVQVAIELGYKTMMDVYEAKITAWQAFLVIKKVREPAPEENKGEVINAKEADD